MKRQKDMTPEDKPPMSEGIQYATGEKQRITNGSSKNVTGSKQKQHSVMDVSGIESKV